MTAFQGGGVEIIMLLSICQQRVGLADEACLPQVPRKVSEVLRSNYPKYRVVELADLNKDDQEIWTSAYHSACPGFVSGQFSAKHEEYAALLMRAEPGAREIKVVLLQPQEDGNVSQREIFHDDKVALLPVIRRSAPGTYKEADGPTKVRAQHDVVLIEHLESSVVAVVIGEVGVKTLTISE